MTNSFIANCRKEAVRNKYRETDDYIDDYYAFHYGNKKIATQFYTVFPKNALEVIRQEIEEREEVIISGLAHDLAYQILYFNPQLVIDIREGVTTNNSKELREVFKGILDKVFTVYLGDLLSDYYKKLIMMECADLFCYYERLSIEGKLADVEYILQGYYRENLERVLNNNPVREEIGFRRATNKNRKYEKTVCPSIEIHNWLEDVCKEIKKIPEIHWILEPYLVRELRMRGISLLDYFALEDKIREKIFSSAQKACNESERGMFKTFSRYDEKITWCGTEEQLDKLLYHLVEEEIIYDEYNFKKLFKISKNSQQIESLVPISQPCENPEVVVKNVKLICIVLAQLITLKFIESSKNIAKIITKSIVTEYRRHASLQSIRTYLSDYSKPREKIDLPYVHEESLIKIMDSFSE